MKNRNFNRLAFVFMITLGVFATGQCAHIAPGEAPDADNRDQIFQLSFDPHDSEKGVIDLIRSARESVYISLYGFDNPAIEQAIVDLWHERGTSKSLAYAKAHKKVKIDTVTEYDSEKEGSWARLIEEGIPVHLHNDSGIMHNKYFVVDEKYVITGSTNLTEGMWHHFNNMIILKSPELAVDFLRDFHVQKTGTSASQKDDRFVELYESGAGADETIGTGDDTTAGNMFGDKVICDESLDGLDAATCADIKSGIKKWSDVTLTATQWDATTNTGFNAALYSADDYNTFKGKWPEKSRQVGVNNITVYFTPYRETYGSYLYQEGTAGGRDYYYMNYDKGLIEEQTYENAMNIVIPLLEAATKSVTIYTFAFTDRVIIDRLIKAHEQRGVNVKVYMDYNMFRSMYRYSAFTYRTLAEKVKNVKVTRKSDGGLLHHKVIMIDDEILILGSLNFSNNAVSSNDENFLVIRNASALIDSFKTEAYKINKNSKYLLDLESFSGAYDANDNEITPFLPVY